MEAKIYLGQVGSSDLLFQRVKGTLDQWNQNFLTRKELRQLEDYQLDDIGVNRADALREAAKPFWQN